MLTVGVPNVTKPSRLTAVQLACTVCVVNTAMLPTVRQPADYMVSERRDRGG